MTCLQNGAECDLSSDYELYSRASALSDACHTSPHFNLDLLESIVF